MAYSSKKAPGRANNADPKGVLQGDVIASGGKASNQELLTGRGTKTVGTSVTDYSDASYTGIDREVGNQVQIAANLKGTNVLKDPMNAYRSMTYPAVENPDPVKNRSGVNRAPGRRKPNAGPTV